MDAHVLHIGTDDCHRVAVLRSVGYRVDECASLPQMERALERTKGADAVFVTESDGISPEQIISLARARSAAPVILFRRSNRDTSEEAFDLVIEPLTSPARWLREVGVLVEWSRGVRARSSVIADTSRSRKAKILRWDWERTRGGNVNAFRTWNSQPGSH